MKNIVELKSALLEQTEAVCQHLLPQGTRVGPEFCVGSLAGEPGKSLKVHLAGSKAGIWSDFATGDGGDIIALWQKVRGLTLQESLAEIRDYLGLADRIYPVRARSYAKPAECDIQRLGKKERAWLTDIRKLSEKTIEAYRLKAERGYLLFPHYRGFELVHWKKMPINRDYRGKLTRTSAKTEPTLFGWQVIDEEARDLIITEGELDALAMYEYGLPAVSVPFGAGTGNKNAWIETDWERLEQMEEIYLCFDMDEPGRQAAIDVAQRLGPYRCYIAELPAKDANECLMRGLPSSAIKAALQQAETLHPRELKDIAEYRREVLAHIHPGPEQKSWFSPTFSPRAANVRFNPGEVSIWSGINGHGKTTVLLQTALDGASQSERFCIASMEMKPEVYISTLVRQAAKAAEPAAMLINDIMDWLSGKIWIYDRLGHADREQLLEAFAYAHKRYGVRQFVIDSLLKCGIAEDDYNTQKRFVEELTDFALEHSCHIHLVAHSRKKYNEHEQAGKMDIRGTGAITDLAANVLILWRNKRKERAKQNGKAAYQEEPDAVLMVEKQRILGWEGNIALSFHPECRQYFYDRKGLNDYFIPVRTVHDEPPPEQTVPF